MFEPEIVSPRQPTEQLPQGVCPQIKCCEVCVDVSAVEYLWCVCFCYAKGAD